MKRVLIIFLGDHLAYSPSTLALFNYLRQRQFSVKLLANRPNPRFTSQVLIDPDILYLDISNLRHGLFARIRARFAAIWNRVTASDSVFKSHQLTPLEDCYVNRIRQEHADCIIAVDFFALWCVQRIGLRAHLLSLQIEEDRYMKACNVGLLQSVIIQSEIRYKTLFGTVDQTKPPFYILPNSQPLEDFIPDFASRNKSSLVYCGSALIDFGIFSCLDFLNDFDGYTLTIKGAVPKSTKYGIENFYGHLLDSGRVIIDEEYLSPEELTRYLARFRIGFAFYDFYRFENLRNRNYYTAPSGKMYQYFNSGVPIIANEFSGFGVVTEKRAGVLVGSLGSLSIKKAIDSIEGNYEEFARNSKKLSYDYDINRFLEGIPKWLGLN